MARTEHEHPAVRLAIAAELLPAGVLYGLTLPMPMFLRRSAVLAVVLMAAFGRTSPSRARAESEPGPSRARSS
ncbi:hypothetical protein GCM10014715_72030 [Streptomyces spiralis]|uniref:Uncharacterized protein n=1 Tax=Streptomyces spiralis TaxID=66376 RepID=A0A919E2L0_9ACTN|nr:hypothetical protein [Streptomyces spiralis]GHF05487.1 hypothetical protein GCM10014715_72030 [Streptomyces spiralis]